MWTAGKKEYLFCVLCDLDDNELKIGYKNVHCLLSMNVPMYILVCTGTVKVW